MTALLGSATGANDRTQPDPRDELITHLRDQLAQARAAASANNWVAIVELARVAQLAGGTETVNDAWRAGRQHVLDLIERRLTELRRGPRKGGPTDG